MPTVDDYLAKLPDDRRTAIAKVRDVINANLPSGYEERLQWGMISWCVPESVLPARDVYNKQPLCFAGLASQKHHMAVYLMCVYGDAGLRSWFESAYKRSGKKLDMGESCVRFKTLDALPVELIGEAVGRVTVESYVASYRRVRAETKPMKRAEIAKQAAGKQTVAKQTVTKQTAAKHTAANQIVAKRTVVKQTGAKCTAANQTVAKRTAANQTVAKRTVVKQTAAKQTVVKQTAAKQTVAKQTAAKQTVAKRTVVKQTAAKQTVAKQTAAKQTVAKQTAAKQTAAKKIVA